MKKIALLVLGICLSYTFSSAQQEKVVFFDDFSNNVNQWASGFDNEQVYLDLSNGFYYFEHKRTVNSWVTYKKVPFLRESSFKIEASFRKISGVQNNGYGLIFGRKDSDNEFQFEVSGDGHFRVDKMQNGVSSEVKPWTASTAIVTGNGATNTLKVAKSGTSMRYFINDELVFTSNYQFFFGDEVGFTVSQNQRIGIDFLRISSILDVAEVIFEDDFVDNKSNWATAAPDENKSLAIKDGHYFFEHKRTENSWVSYKLIPIETNRDFKIESYIRKEGGVQNSGYGLVFGRENNDNEYEFEISGDGHFRVDKYENGQFVEIKAWEKTSAINQGNGVINKLSVVKIGNTIKMYINEQQVYSMNFQQFFGDAIGYRISRNQTIAADLLRVSYLGNKPQKVVKVPDSFENPNREEIDPPQILPSDKRLALIIGNSEYQNGGSLPNPVNDARSMEAALKKVGFTVLKYENCDLRTMKIAIDDFGKKLKEYDVGLFFYAGHGIQVDGSNYLIPSNAVLDNKQDVDYDCVRAGRVLAKMEASKTKTNIVILDACRDNPFERSWSRSTKGNGLAFMNAPQGSVIAYATSPGRTASDGIGSNGLYTTALLQNLDRPGVSIMDMFQNVRAKVIKDSRGLQIPWESTSLIGKFYFKR